MGVLVSIVMPALNEENNIERALKSIKMQNIGKDEVEILVVDGGSVDRTRDIAEGYNARILENLKVVPEEAKKIGTNESSGKYIVFLDADEEFTDKNQLMKRVELFRSVDDLKVIFTNGLLTPKRCPELTRYVNSCGDPFSYFVYRFDSEDLISSLVRKRCKYVKAGEKGRVYYVSDADFNPIGDSGATMLDLEYLKTHFTTRLEEPDFVASKFDEVIDNTGCYGIIEGDNINHYSIVTFKMYLRKLKFRVINNLYPRENISGFTTRASLNRRLNIRKYLFPAYCLIPPIVIIDAIILAVRKKSVIFLLHFPFVYITLFYIICYLILKLCGVKAKNFAYGK